MTSKILPAIFGLAALTGCGAAARSPETYRDDTKKVLDTKNEAIHACYDKVLEGDPTAHGTVTVVFEVDTERGAIANLQVDKAKTTAPDPVAECVTKSISGLAIAPPDGRQGQASWVYEFAPPQPPAPSPTAGSG